ncbi:hydroxyethylthiazole kinase [Sporosarcina sp. NCCP-2716]|uniref:hydroxyethylthiazole kinase n=1 Tax=Sporosarcina sp. NCCP-2716 TaxID=2943679 RepID=UPI002040F1FF|nr:hydroxyethylthiazole kinase [Sporosarcina sp. NCCP-2716]GKV68488.1 hydroxyethylthiazole kinase [Sporosarcina sp. NCCP-2716]
MHAAKRLAEVRRTAPLVHCMTNIVAANLQANGLLALGASPVMADGMEEAGEIAALASCTVLNIGTPDARKIEAMIAAGKSARAAGHPLILDPVGAGATRFRKQSAERLLRELDVSLVRGNAGEIAAIAGIDWKAKGVDAGSGNADIAAAARSVAKKYCCLVAVSGEEDIVTDGTHTIRVSGGHPAMTGVSGTGCLLSAVCAAFLAACTETPLETVASALAFYKKAGESAAAAAEGPGDFPIQLLNSLNRLDGTSTEYRQFTMEEEAIS